MVCNHLANLGQACYGSPDVNTVSSEFKPASATQEATAVTEQTANSDSLTSKIARTGRAALSVGLNIAATGAIGVVKFLSFTVIGSSNFGLSCKDFFEENKDYAEKHGPKVFKSWSREIDEENKASIDKATNCIKGKENRIIAWGKCALDTLKLFPAIVSLVLTITSVGLGKLSYLAYQYGKDKDAKLPKAVKWLGLAGLGITAVLVTVNKAVGYTTYEALQKVSDGMFKSLTATQQCAPQLASVPVSNDDL